MKKLFVIMAVACAALMVSCGSNSVKNKAIYFAEKLAEAELADSDAQESMIEEEMEKYLDGLTIAEEELFEEIFSIKYEAIMEGEIKKEMKEVLDEVAIGAGDELTKVYSKAYDGYLNVRAQPTTKGQILGRLSNGPEGAELLGVEGKWTKVRVNGVVGYVWSADVQTTPTEPVYVDAAAVIGDWYNEDFLGGNWYDKITIKSNGKFVKNAWMGSDCNDQTNGTWSLSLNKLVLKWPDGTIYTSPVNGKSLTIGGSKYIKQ